MVTRVGFIVEGPSEKRVIESEAFDEWLRKRGMALVQPVVVAGGHGGMVDGRLNDLARGLRVQAGEVDRIVGLMDLDPDEYVPCVQARKNTLGATEQVDLIVVARKAIESWFLAHSSAMRHWTGDSDFVEEWPERTPLAPWDRLKEIGKQSGRGPGGSKVTFAKRIVRCGFTIEGSARHPNCESAVYFVKRVGELAGKNPDAGTLPGAAQ